MANHVEGDMLRVFVAIAIGTLAGAAGQICMRRGMQVVGPLESYAILDMLGYFWRSLLNPWVIAGTVLSGILYFALLAALGWTDVTVAFPMTALEYGFAAVLAVLFLRESVPLSRWIGIVLVMIGVILIGFGSSGDVTKTPPTSSSINLQVDAADREGASLDRTS